jgi:hypothetical protein
MKIKLNIQCAVDRENIIIALANAGISVHIEKETYLAKDNYYIIFEYKSEKGNK